MVEADNDGISLFSIPLKKKTKVFRELTARQRHDTTPENEAALREADQNSTAAQERSEGEAPQTRQAVEANDHDGTAAADTEGLPSTSGRAAEHERPVTFRSLGISEWLDR